MIAQAVFIIVLIAAIWLFSRNVGRIRRNIRLGRKTNRSDRRGERWATMMRVALGQQKMVKRPVAGFLHLLVYAGFIIINIEVLEIILDGIFGTHRVFAAPLGGWYNGLIAAFEILALGVLLGCAAFLARRNILKLRRFSGTEMTAWPKSDANYILIAEILLMAAFLTMNGADLALQQRNIAPYSEAGAFPVSRFLVPLLPASTEALKAVERTGWWIHITGILIFLNYIPYSKHLHIFLAFPNTWYSNLEPKGRFANMASVTREVEAMLGPAPEPGPAAAGDASMTAAERSGDTNPGPGDTNPITAPGTEAGDIPERFGARDVTDLSRINLLNAYSCTECGRCTAVCPANITGKLLSPRKIMMDTRDRLEEVGRHFALHGKDHPDGKALLGDYITTEELWACTTCNACTEACPVNIDPLEIIMELRQNLVMEESRAPQSWNAMFNNVENNGAPWQFSPADRLKWTEQLNI